MKRINWPILIFFVFLCLCAALGRLDLRSAPLPASGSAAEEK